MIIEAPFSHVEVITDINLHKFRLSPAARIIIKESKIFLLDDHASKVFEMDYSPCLEKLFQELKEKSLSEHQILKLLKTCFKEKSKEVLNELIEMGVIW
jgi:hypothetical protein